MIWLVNYKVIKSVSFTKQIQRNKERNDVNLTRILVTHERHLIIKSIIFNLSHNKICQISSAYLWTCINTYPSNSITTNFSIIGQSWTSQNWPFQSTISNNSACFTASFYTLETAINITVLMTLSINFGSSFQEKATSTQ